MVSEKKTASSKINGKKSILIAGPKPKVPPIKGTATYNRQLSIFKDYKAKGMKGLHGIVQKHGGHPGSASLMVKSKTWKFILNEQMPDELLAERHVELLNKRDITHIKDSTGAIVQTIDNGPETAAVSKALEMAYRLKGSYDEQKGDEKKVNIYNLIYKPEYKKLTKDFEDSLKTQFYGEDKNDDTEDEDEQGEYYDPNSGGSGDYSEDNGVIDGSSETEE